LPTGAQFDRTTQRFSWQPDYGQRGTYSVKFTVKDASGGEDTMSVGIVVVRLNRPPKLEKPRDVTLKVGEPFELQLVATDEDKEDKLTFTATGLPDGATLSPEGKLTFTPTEKTVGKFTVQVSVKDDFGAEDTKSFSITVSKPNLPKQPK
jgi:PKD repeat protein